MKKISIFFILFALLISVISFSSCDGNTAPEYKIVVQETAQVQITEQGFVVEAGNTFTIPQCEVYNSAGQYCEEFQVARVITDANGNRKAGTLQMKHGEVYNVVYTATNGEIELTKEMKLYCYDTVLPTLSLLNMQRMYNKGETISIKVNTISNDVDYEKSTIVLKNETTGQTTPISFKDTFTFVSENESEVYNVVADLVDVNGNKQTIKYTFLIAGNFTDTNINDYVIWDFDEAGYINNIKVAGESDDLAYSIETADIPDGANGGVLKLELKANERYVLTLINGNSVLVEDCSNVGFRMWANEVVDIFEIYNVEDASMYDLSWKYTHRNNWQNVEFNPLGTFAFDYSLNSIKIVLSCEEDVTIYIDSVYANEYVEPWRDEDIDSDDLAMFDDNGYYERLSEQLIGDNTYTSTYEIVYSIPGTTDFSGGALKFTSTGDPTLYSGGFMRDGFKYQLFDKLSYTDLVGKGFLFRMYMENTQTSLSVDVYDQKLGQINLGWFTLRGSSDRWVNIIIPYEQIADKIDGCENITYLNIRIIRRTEDSEAGVTDHVTYFDKISIYDFNYDKVNYTFVEDYDTLAVENMGYCTGFRIEDDLAKDGWALYGITGLDATMSGVNIKFNHLDLSEYASIYVRLRTVKSSFDNNNVNIGANGIHLKYGPYPNYEAVDILPMMLEKGITYLDSIYVGAKYCSGIGIYIDDIIFVKKEDAPVYEDFTLDASELQQFVGTTGISNYEGGNVSCVDMSTVAIGSYKGKDNILTFKTVNCDDFNYSGGGLYIDLREYVTGGKIVVAQDFTITISIYLPASTGHRLGVVYGENLGSHSFKNNWKNPYVASQGAGWYTITITSDELRALDGCANVEMTGIYLGIVPGNYTCGIESVTFTFDQAE